MTRLAWKVFISSKPCRLIVILLQGFVQHMFDKLLFLLTPLKIAISYKVKKEGIIPEGIPSFLHEEKFSELPYHMLCTEKEIGESGNQEISTGPATLQAERGRASLEFFHGASALR